MVEHWISLFSEEPDEEEWEEDYEYPYYNYPEYCWNIENTIPKEHQRGDYEQD